MLDLNEINAAINKLESQEATFATVSKLADLYAIRDRLEPKRVEAQHTYSAASVPSPQQAESDFLAAVAGRDQRQVWDILDELMDTLAVVNPRAYSSVMRKIYNADKATR